MVLGLPLTLLGGCGWVDSTGKSSADAIERYQELTGVNDIVDLVGEETQRIDASRLLQANNDSGNSITTVAGAASSISWQRIGGANFTDCPLANVNIDSGIALRQACDHQLYNPEEPATVNGVQSSNTGRDSQHVAVGALDANCDLHILEVEGQPGVYELHAPAVTQPVVLQYRLTVEEVLGGASGNNSGDDSDSATTVTVCLQP